MNIVTHWQRYWRDREARLEKERALVQLSMAVAQHRAVQETVKFAARSSALCYQHEFALQRLSLRQRDVEQQEEGYPGLDALDLLAEAAASDFLKRNASLVEGLLLHREVCGLFQQVFREELEHE